MPGFLEHEQDGRKTRYCLVPAKVGPDFAGKDYFPGLPLSATPNLTSDGRQFVDPMGKPVRDAVPVLERDFWAPMDRLYTIHGWPCYPLNFGLFSKLPMPLIDLLIQNTRTDWETGRGQGTYQVSWGGLTITRHYRVSELGVGVAIWPRRAMPKWTQYFLLFAPGTKENVEAMPFGASASGHQLECTVYAVTDGKLDQGEAAIVYGGKAAMARSTHIPRMIALKPRGAEVPEHGILPLLHTLNDGEFAMPRPADTGARRSVFTEVKLPDVTRVATSAYIAVDFGTTNTAVAVAVGSDEGEVLQFSDAVLAKKLTESAGLDPSHLLESRYGFFAMNRKPANPLPTVIVEIDSGLEPFANLSSLPLRSIPGDPLDENVIQPWVRAGHLKQEFKWQQDDAGDDLRAAFLEMLARLVGLELRTQGRYRSLQKAQIIFTCPLSFSHSQTEQLRGVQDRFKTALEECGFEVSLRGGLVSESLANLYLIRKQKTGVGSSLPEERHVVIDIGGGSTDISVFTGTGDPLWLDSLYIGGKDFAETVLLKRLGTNGHDAAMSAAVQKIFEKPVEYSQSVNAGKTLQQLLLLRLERSMEAVAKSFQGSALEGTPADFIALLVFATAYGVRMASLGTSAGLHVPDGTDIRVWFMGLGSRLFELSPLARTLNDRLASARRVLEDTCRRVLPANTTVTFDWREAREAKLSVCRGALLVPNDQPGLDLQTLFWADFPAAKPPIQWRQSYDRDRVMAIDDTVRRSLVTESLVECIAAAIQSTARHLGFEANDPDVTRLKRRITEDYSAGVSRIVRRERNAPPHPLVSATDGLKENLVGLLHRPDGGH